MGGAGGIGLASIFLARGRRVTVGVLLGIRG